MFFVSTPCSTLSIMWGGQSCLSNSYRMPWLLFISALKLLVTLSGAQSPQAGRRSSPANFTDQWNLTNRCGSTHAWLRECTTPPVGSGKAPHTRSTYSMYVSLYPPDFWLYHPGWNLPANIRVTPSTPYRARRIEWKDRQNQRRHLPPLSLRHWKGLSFKI
jgi:hypothetical protein